MIYKYDKLYHKTSEVIIRIMPNNNKIFRKYIGKLFRISILY